MDYLNLGKTGLKVSRLCLGCMTYGVPSRGAHPWSLDEEQSRPYFRRALELGPRFHDLRYRLGRLLLESGQVLEARDVLSALVAEHPHFVDAQAALGLSCYLSGDAIEAQRVWRECLASRPASARIEADLSMVERART